jgi:hypothetical protein
MVASPEYSVWLLRGVEFIDEGLVTSTNDIVSEVTYSFRAFDYKPLAKISVLSEEELGAEMDTLLGGILDSQSDDYKYMSDTDKLALRLWGVMEYKEDSWPSADVQDQTMTQTTNFRP